MTAKEKYNLIRIAEGLQDLNRSVSTLKQHSSFDINSIISNDDLIRRMRICRKTAFNWRKKGLLGFNKVGRKIYYKSSDVARLLETTSNTGFGLDLLSM